MQGATNPSNNNVRDSADKDCSLTAVKACVKFVRQRQCSLCLRIQEHIMRDVKACTCMYMCVMLSDRLNDRSNDCLNDASVLCASSLQILMTSYIFGVHVYTCMQVCRSILSLLSAQD